MKSIPTYRVRFMKEYSPFAVAVRLRHAPPLYSDARNGVGVPLGRLYPDNWPTECYPSRHPLMCFCSNTIRQLSIRLLITECNDTGKLGRSLHSIINVFGHEPFTSRCPSVDLSSAEQCLDLAAWNIYNFTVLVL